MFSGPFTLQIEVGKITDGIVEAVKKLSFVSKLSQDGNMLTIQLNTRNDVR
jgi:hypothetical protein